MYYYQRPPRRETTQYFMPFLIILFLAGIGIAGWRLLNTLFIEDSRSTVNERVFLDIEEGGVKAMAADSTEWDGVPDKIYLYRGEKVKTGSDGRATLTFFNESLIRLNHDSELHLQTLKSKKEADVIELTLKEGHLWVKVPELKESEASFTLNTPSLSVGSRGGLFAVSSPGTVYMMEGSAQISVKDKEELLKTYALGVGQQLMMDEEGITKLKNDQELDVIFALSDAFKKSDWYRWNKVKDGAMVDLEEETEEGEEANDFIPDSDRESSASRPRASEDLPDSPLPRPVQNGTGQGNDTEEDDDTAPSMPEITEPGKNDETITLKEAAVFIKGSVSGDTAAVFVNDYKLQLYKSGSRTFTYHANVAYDNLKAGENEYKIVAEDKAGNRSVPALITLVLPQEVKDKADTEAEASSKEPEAESESETEETSAPAEVTGGVTITAPNNGENFSTIEIEFVIQGVVPEGTSKVLVNDYALSKFQKGDTAWSYKATKSLGNLEIGKKNTYTVKAYDEANGLLGTDSLTIDVESEGSPQITIPTSRSSYLTTLDELVLGGTVGKWVQTVYVNDQKLLNYIPGSEKWQYTVKLNSGKNTFKVVGESNGVKTASDEIEITYQP